MEHSVNLLFALLCSSTGENEQSNCNYAAQHSLLWKIEHSKVQHSLHINIAVNFH